MKTVILLCSLATFATAIPTLIKGTFKELESALHEPSATIKREKKSPLHDPVHEEIQDHEKDILPTNTGFKSHIVAPGFEERSLGFKKPLIIKKKFGYHLYRDSDEEMAYADPHEKCRKQVKVKLCDDEPSIYSNKLSKSTKSARLDLSEKEVEHSIKMAKEAVENLQRNIEKMEENSMKLRENSKNENLATDTEVLEDIETARKALEHITENFESLESRESSKNEDILIPKSADDERLAQWKEAIENIHKNFEIARNIEDAFRFESLNSFSSENIPTTKLTDEMSKVDEHEIQEKSNDELQDDSKNELKNDKNIDEEGKNEEPFGKSSSFEERRIENDDDIFTSTSNNKEFQIELHSDSLRQEKTADLENDNMEKGAMVSAETKMANLDEELPKLKNAEDTTDDQFHFLSTPHAQPSSGKSALSFSSEDLQKQSSAEIKNKEIPSLAKEADIEDIYINGKDSYKPISKSSEVTSDFQTHEEIKEIIEAEKSNAENLEELFVPKEATNTDKMLSELTDTNTHYLQEKNANEQENEAQLLSLPLDSESHDELKMRESLDTLPKENKIYKEEEHRSDTFDENVPSTFEDKLFRNVNMDSSQEITSEGRTDGTEESFNMRSVQEKHVIVEPSSLITPINFNKQKTTNENLSTSMRVHDSMSRTTEDLDSQGTNILRSVQESDNKNDDIISNSFSIQKEQKHAKTNEGQNIVNPNNDLQSFRLTQENEFETKNHHLINQQNIVNEQMNMRMAEDHIKGHSLLQNHALNDSPNLGLTHLIPDLDNIDPKFKTAATYINKESLQSTKNNPDEQHRHASNELFSQRTTGDLTMEREAAKNVDQRELHFMQLSPREQSEVLPQGFKSASTFHNDKSSLTTDNNALDFNQRPFNGKQGVRMTEDSNMEEYFNPNRNLEVAPVTRWSEDRQRMDHTSPDFKSASNSPNGHTLLMPSKGADRYDEERPSANMRMNEGRYTGQQYNYNNNHQLHDMQSMAWLEDKQYKHLMEQYNHVPEYNNNHYRPYLQQHGYGRMNRFNQFDSDNNHDQSPMPSRSHNNHDHTHLMRDSKMSELDSSMQSSNLMNMRDNGLQWGQHRGMARTAFGTGLPLAGVNPGTVGVFPTANTGCGIPLMLSCSPSVVSGSLAKVHPSIPAFRSDDDDIMFYTKRDASNKEETPVKIQRRPFNHKSELILNKQ